MALGQTAELAVLLTLKDEMTASLTKAEAELKGFNNTAKSSGTQVTTVGSALKTAEAKVSSFGTAVGKVKTHITNLLSGPVGMIGLGAGLFTLAGAFEAGVGKAEDMALAVEKLSGVTGMGAHAASQYIAVFEKFGISSDRTVQVAGFAEKTLGKLADTQAKAAKSAALLALEQEKANIQLAGGKVKAIDAAIAHQKAVDAVAAHGVSLTKLDALDQQFGLHLKDANGHVVDFGTELGQIADLFNNKQIPATERATVAAQLLGRGYVSLIPVLKLGSQGIAEAAKEADQLGLTLKNAQDVTNVHNFIAAERDAKDAIAGLEVQLGLLIMPNLTPVLKQVTTFIMQNQGQIKKFFTDAISAAKTIAGDVVAIGGAFKSAWDAIPPEFRDLIVKGLIANKVMKVTLGFSLLDVGKALLSSLGVLGIKAAVVNVSGGIVNGGGVPVGGNAGAAVEDAAGGLSLAAIGTAVGAWVAGIGGAIGLANIIKTVSGTSDQQQQYQQTHGQFGPRSASLLPGGSNSNVSPGDTAALIAQATAKIGATDAALRQAEAKAANTTPELLRQQIGWLRLLAEKGIGAAAADRAITLAELKRHGGSLVTLNANIKALQEAERKAIKDGDTAAAQSIGQDIRLLQQRLVAVEQARQGEQARAAALITGAISLAQNAIVLAISRIPGAPAFLSPVPGGRKQPGRGGVPGGTTPSAPPGGYSGLGSGGGRGGHRAAGGPVGYSVGEDGPELLTMYPSGGGYVTPMGRGEKRQVVVAVNARVTTRSVDAAQAAQSRYGPTPARAGAATVLID